jgi:hypothetical protein
MPRYIFIALLVVGACCGMIWAMHPLLSPPQGLMPSDWSDAQLIRDRYPFHLIAPTWVSDVAQWMFAETFARLGAILVCIFIFIFAKVKHHEKPAA